MAPYDTDDLEGGVRERLADVRAEPLEVRRVDVRAAELAVREARVPAVEMTCHIRIGCLNNDE